MVEEGEMEVQGQQQGLPCRQEEGRAGPRRLGSVFPGETVAGKQGEPGAEGVRSRHPGKCVFIPNVEKEILVLIKNPYCAK